MKPRWYRRAAALVVLGVAAFGCSKGEPAEAKPAEAKSTEKPPRRSVPKVHISSRLPAPKPEAGARIDKHRAELAGAELHAQAAKVCETDQKCLLQSCSKLCRQWMDQEQLGGLAPHQMNGLYFGCTGYCLDPNPND